MAGVDAERCLEVAARPGGVAEPVARELGGADSQRRVRRLGGRRGEVALERGERLLEAAGVGVVLERLERGGLAGGIQRERLGERGERAVRVAEADDVDARHLEVEGDERGAIPGLRREPGERIGVRAVITLLRVDTGEQLERGGIAGEERPGAVDPRERARDTLGIVGEVELGEPELERGGLAAVARLRHARLERARLVAPGARERPEPLAGRSRAGGGAVERERLDDRVGREAVLERLVHEPRRERGVLGREGRAVGARVARNVEQPLRLREVAECGERGHPAGSRLGEAWIEAARPRVQERGAVAPAEALLVQHPESQREPRRVGRGRSRGRALEDRREPRPILAILEELPEGGERPRVRWLRVQELAVELLRPGDVAELGPRERRRLGEERRAGLRHEPRAPLVERDEILPARRLLVERLERLERAGISGRGLQGLEVRPDLLVQGRCAQGGYARREEGPGKRRWPGSIGLAARGGQRYDGQISQPLREVAYIGAAEIDRCRAARNPRSPACIAVSSPLATRSRPGGRPPAPRAGAPRGQRRPSADTQRGPLRERGCTRRAPPFARPPREPSRHRARASRCDRCPACPGERAPPGDR